MKKFYILPFIFLYLGNVFSQSPVELNLSGTVSGNNHYKAIEKINSSQTISGGKTIYSSGKEIIFQNGFTVQSGAEFEAVINKNTGSITNLYEALSLINTKAGKYESTST